jgi:hypothetical protein
MPVEVSSQLQRPQVKITGIMLRRIQRALHIGMISAEIETDEIEFGKNGAHVHSSCFRNVKKNGITGEECGHGWKLVNKFGVGSLDA